MAKRRMFAKTIIDSDAFLDMPMSTQATYFHLSMRADDEGFINSPKKILRMIGGAEDDLKILLAKKFVLGFDSGVVVIKHWKIHNLLRKDRVEKTMYSEEKSLVHEKDNGSYSICQPDVNQMTTKCTHSIVKDSIGEDSIGEDKITTLKSYDDAFRLSNYLLNHILKINPSFKRPNLDTWAKDVDKAIRLDGRTVEQLKECIDWIYTPDGSFWQKNILSGKKLREKFDTMNMQAMTKEPTTQEKKLSDKAKMIYNHRKKKGHSEEEIRAELDKLQ